MVRSLSSCSQCLTLLLYPQIIIALPLRALFYLLTCTGRISHLRSLHNRASSQSSCDTAELAPLPLHQVITPLSRHGPHFLLLLPAGWVGRVDCMCFKLTSLQLFSEHCYPGEHCATLQGSPLIAICVSNSVIYIQIKPTGTAARCTAAVLSTLRPLINSYFINIFMPQNESIISGFFHHSSIQVAEIVSVADFFSPILLNHKNLYTPKNPNCWWNGRRL